MPGIPGEGNILSQSLKKFSIQKLWALSRASCNICPLHEALHKAFRGCHQPGQRILGSPSVKYQNNLQTMSPASGPSPSCIPETQPRNKPSDPSDKFPGSHWLPLRYWGITRLSLCLQLLILPAGQNGTSRIKIHRLCLENTCSFRYLPDNPPKQQKHGSWHLQKSELSLPTHHPQTCS